MNKEILEKWSKLITAAKNYYVDNQPTGMLDSEYDQLEERAIQEDGFYVRNYIFNNYFPKGERYKNSYIEKFKKEKVVGSMYKALSEYQDYYLNLKYDGTSMAVYVDPKTGKPIRAVTCGNSSLGVGIDQTWKILGLGFIPQLPLGIVAIQCECLVDLDRLPEGLDPEKARQKANGIINGKKENIIEDAKKYLTLRAYRYYTDNSIEGLAINQGDYRDVLYSFPTVVDPEDGHIKFAPADIYTYDELGEFCESDHTRTSTGYFLNDGYIVYSKSGKVIKGLKFEGAGASSEGVISSNVKEIQWNNKSKSGKDSWSANVLLDPPVNLHGSNVSKPGAGSVKKLIDNKISVGAVVSVVLANSTIPVVGNVIKEGNGDYCWPTCSCGYKMSEKDIYGSNLKCGNPLCSDRMDRMRKVLSGYKNIHEELNLNEYLVIDRFKWEEQEKLDINKLLGFIEVNDKSGYYEYLITFMKTPLQLKNMNLVWEASFIVLREFFEACS